MEGLVVICVVATAAVASSTGSSPNGFLGGLESDLASLKQSWGPNSIDKNSAQDAFSNINSTSVILSRTKRTLSFPSGTSGTLQLKLKMTHWTYGTTSVSGDYRLEFSMDLPSGDERRRKRSLSQERNALFSIVQSAFDKSGLDGRSCILRAVCEVADAPMDELGMYGELLNLIFSPGYKGSTEFPVHCEAEDYGRSHGGCWAAFPQCPISMRGALKNAFLNNMDTNTLSDTPIDISNNYV